MIKALSPLLVVVFVLLCIVVLTIYVMSTYEQKVVSEPGYHLYNLQTGELLITSPCPEGMVARINDLDITAPTYKGVLYAEGRIFLTPSQAFLIVRTPAFEPPPLCGLAYAE